MSHDPLGHLQLEAAKTRKAKRGWNKNPFRKSRKHHPEIIANPTQRRSGNSQVFLCLHKTIEGENNHWDQFHAGKDIMNCRVGIDDFDEDDSEESDEEKEEEEEDSNQQEVKFLGQERTTPLNRQIFRKKEESRDDSS